MDPVLDEMKRTKLGTPVRPEVWMRWLKHLEGELAVLAAYRAHERDVPPVTGPRRRGEAA